MEDAKVSPNTRMVFDSKVGKFSHSKISDMSKISSFVFRPFTAIWK